MTNHRDPSRAAAAAAATGDSPTAAPPPSLPAASVGAAPNVVGGGTSGADAASIDCLAAARQLWDCLDGELTEERLQLVRAHLEACARCAPHFDFERRFLEALAATRSEQPAPAGLRQRVVRALRGVGFAPG